jgi:hypothetical protein
VIKIQKFGFLISCIDARCGDGVGGRVHDLLSRKRKRR